MGSPVPAVLTKRNKIAVVGFASNTRDDAPFRDGSWEIWGLNNLWNYLPRWDRWFEMHDPKQIEQLYGPEYVAFLKSAAGPVYMQAHYDEFPSSVAFPRLDMEARVVGRQFWPSSISYMLALAIAELSDESKRAIPGAELFIAGIDLLGDDEYNFQREGCGHLIGVAEGRGIKVTIPEKASLLKGAYMYGYESGEFSPDPLVTYALSQAAQYDKKQAEALATVHTYDGAKQAFQTMATMLKHSSRGGVVGGVVPKPPEEKKA
jgi:hypothetical protein